MVIFHSYVKLPEGIQNHQFDGENDDPSQDSGIPYVQINIDLLSLSAGRCGSPVFTSFLVVFCYF